MDSFNNVDEYISSFSEDTQVKLEEMRNLIKKVHPDAVETISYGIPTYKINNKTIVHFGGAKKHIGLYPGAAIVALFKDQLDQYEISKGTTGGFAANRELARIAGAKGGRISRRTKKEA